ISFMRSAIILSDGSNDYPIQINSAGIYLPVNGIVNGNIYLHINAGIIDNQNINDKKILINGTTKPSLSTVITTPNLGQITMVGDTPTTAELETAIKVKNTNYQNGDATFSNITSTGALATGNPKKI
ncbi:hypothetical protein, partial [Spiroplasma sp. ChiS]|uniref:hypothetical protein n=2 Tax=Spiroplasma sp. ChiS TaxID=2099885 RepID=UPI0013922796